VQHDVFAFADLENPIQALQDLVDEGLSIRTAISRSPLAFSVLPEETMSQMYSARPSLGAISTAPEKKTASA
jgi:hypothetical protein